MNKQIWKYTKRQINQFTKLQYLLHKVPPADLEKEPIVGFWPWRPKSKVVRPPDPIYGRLLPWFRLATHSPMDSDRFRFLDGGEEFHLTVSQSPESFLLLLGQAQQLFGEQVTSLPIPIWGSFQKLSKGSSQITIITDLVHKAGSVILVFQDKNIQKKERKSQSSPQRPVELGESLPPGDSEERRFCKEKNSWLQVTGGDQPGAPAWQVDLLEQLLLHLQPYNPWPQVFKSCKDMSAHFLKTISHFHFSSAAKFYFPFLCDCHSWECVCMLGAGDRGGSFPQSCFSTLPQHSAPRCTHQPESHSAWPRFCFSHVARIL